MLDPEPSGIGLFVEALVQELSSSCELSQYALSRKGRHQGADGSGPLLVSGSRLKRQVPARLARRSWARSSIPKVECWTGPVDIVHGTNFIAPTSIAHPVLVTFHDLHLLKKGTIDPTDRRIFRRMANGGVNFHVPTQAIADDLSEHLSVPHSRIHVVNMGTPSVASGSIDETSIALSLGNYILAIGDVVPRKNLVRLIQAFDQFDASGHDMRLVLIGATPDNNELDAVRNVIRQARNHDHIDFGHGWASRGLKGALLRNAKALAYPSIEEGFGFPVLEAQSVGVPVVAGDCGAIREIGGSTVTYVQPNSIESIAAGLEEAINRGGEQGAVIEGRRNALGFTWERCGKEMRDVYAAILA